MYIYSTLLLLSRVHMAFVYRLNARRRRTSPGTYRQVCILKLLPGALLSHSAMLYELFYARLVRASVRTRIFMREM